MVDSCSRENGVLCSVAWSWLLFFHEESEWKNSESNIVWGVDLSSSLRARIVARFMICWVCRLYISWFVCSVLSLDECLIKINYFVYVFDAWRKWSCGVVCVWQRTNSDTIVSMFILFCYLGWMIYEGRLMWFDRLTSEIYQVEGTVFISVRTFVTK